MVSKKELKKMKKTKMVWQDLDELAIKFLKTTNLKDTDKLKMIFIKFPRPIMISNIFISDNYYKRIQIKEATLFSDEKAPPNCFTMPKIFNTHILKYFPNKNQAIIIVKRRKTTKISSTNIKFKISLVSFENLNFIRYQFILKPSYPFDYLLRFIGYNIESPSEGIFRFKFLLEMENIGKLNFIGACNVLSDNQKEIEILLENKTKKLEDRFFEKIIFRSFLKCKEFLQVEGLPFPDPELLMKQMKVKYQQGID